MRQAAQQLRQSGGGSNKPYYLVIEERSLTLQRRLSDILWHVVYEGAADSPLAQALVHHRGRDGQLRSHLPTSFLKAAERAALAQAVGNQRASCLVVKRQGRPRPVLLRKNVIKVKIIS